MARDTARIPILISEKAKHDSRSSHFGPKGLNKSAQGNALGSGQTLIREP
jgi:hypothetical protein